MRAQHNLGLGQIGREITERRARRKIKLPPGWRQSGQRSRCGATCVNLRMIIVERRIEPELAPWAQAEAVVSDSVEARVACSRH